MSKVEGQVYIGIRVRRGENNIRFSFDGSFSSIQRIA